MSHYRRGMGVVMVSLCLGSIIFNLWCSSEKLRHFRAGSSGSWDFEKDAQDLMMSDRKCDLKFPGLFKEVDRAVKHRSRKPITKQEIDKIPRTNGYIRAMIYNQKLYVIDAKGTFFSREHATLHALHRAILTSPEPLPNVEFAFLTDDIVSPQPIWYVEFSCELPLVRESTRGWPRREEFAPHMIHVDLSSRAYSRNYAGKDLWLMPDFGYWSWPEPKIGSYSELQLKVATIDAETPWQQKRDQIVWRGALVDLPVREALLNETSGKDWADVRGIIWGNKTDLAMNHLSIAAHCRYKYVAHTEGTSNSGRLKFIQNCRSVVVSHKLNWIQHHHHLMVSSGPNQNFVEVKRDWSDLEQALHGLQRDEVAAERIAENNIKTFKEHYLTPAGETCYWRKLIRGWASVSFKPEFAQTTEGRSKWRGIPVESFFLMRGWSGAKTSQMVKEMVDTLAFIFYK